MLDHILNDPAPFDLEQTLKELTEENEKDYVEFEAYLKSLGIGISKLYCVDISNKISSNSERKGKPQSSLYKGRPYKDYSSKAKNALEEVKFGEVS